MTQIRLWIISLGLSFLSNLLVMFVPLPVGPCRCKLVGRRSRCGDIEFYSHPRFVCCMHLIWFGYLVAAVGVLYDFVLPATFSSGVLMKTLTWIWLLILLGTIASMGLDFGRVACGFIAAAVVIVALTFVLLRFLLGLPALGSHVGLLRSIPIEVSWGVPCMVSFMLGLTYAAVVTWQSINDRWILPCRGNFLEHVNFQHSDRAISKGAKNFVAVFPCLLRRYLNFGYGDIEVYVSGRAVPVDRIEGVFFASYHTQRIKQLFSTTDVTVDEAAEEEMLEEQGTDIVSA